MKNDLQMERRITKNIMKELAEYLGKDIIAK